MNNYTFRWALDPSLPVEYSANIVPFDVFVRDTLLTLSAKANSATENHLQERAGHLSAAVAQTLTYLHGTRFVITCDGYDEETPNGRNLFTSISLGASVSFSGSADFELRDIAGNVVDSSAMRRNEEHKITQAWLVDIATKSTIDVHLRDMLDHWSRYIGDSEGRLHPLYDILQVAERLHGNRSKAASALNIGSADLNELGRISNDPTLLNGRHLGLSQGPHRVASEIEVQTCERVAKAIIEIHAANVVI